MAVSCSSFVLASDDGTAHEVSLNKNIVKRGAHTFSVDGFGRSSEAIWDQMKSVVRENINEGANTSIIIAGGDSAVSAFFDIIRNVALLTVPSESMRLLDLSLNATVSCCEITNGDKVRDVLSLGAASYQERRIRGGKFEGLTELPLSSEAVKNKLGTAASLLSNTDSSGSCYTADISVRWANGIVARLSHILVYAIPSLSRLVGNIDKSKPTPVAAFSQVVEALLKRKRAFVPYRVSAITQLMSEFIETSKVFFVAAVGGREDTDAQTTLKLASKCREVITSLRSIEEFVGDHEAKTVLLSLRRKVAELSTSDGTKSLEKDSDASKSGGEAAFESDTIRELRIERLQREKAASLAFRRLHDTKQYFIEVAQQVKRAEEARTNAGKAQCESEDLTAQCQLLQEDLEDEKHFNLAANEALEDAKLLEEELHAQRRLQKARGDEAAAGRSLLQAKALASTFRAAHRIGLEQASAQRNVNQIDKLKEDITKTGKTLDALDQDLASATRWHADMKNLAEMAKNQEEAMSSRLAAVRTDIAAIVDSIDSYADVLEKHPIESVGNINDFRESAKLQAEADELRTAELSSQVGSIRIAPQPASQTNAEHRRAIYFGENYAYDALCAFELSEGSLLRKNAETCAKLRSEVEALQNDITREQMKKASADLSNATENLSHLAREYENLQRNYAELKSFVLRREGVSPLHE